MGKELHETIDENKEQILGKGCMESFGGVPPDLAKAVFPRRV